MTLAAFLRIDDHDGTFLGALPEPISWEASVEFSEVGALTLDYPLDGVNSDLLDDLREVYLVSPSGDEYPGTRYVLLGGERDRLAHDTTKRTGRSILWRLSTALVYPNGGTLETGVTTRYFDNRTPGSILKTLFDDAQTRGALAGLSIDFDGALDSAGNAWPTQVRAEYNVRATILSVLQRLVEQGLVEIRTEGRLIRAYATDGLGQDLTAAEPYVILRHGQSLIEAPEQTNAERIAGVALVEGDDGVLVERTDAPTVSLYGRMEAGVTASGVTDTGTLAVLGDAALTRDVERQLTVGLALWDNGPQPLLDFHVGDHVYTATPEGLERVRVRQVVVKREASSALSATAVLGDRIYEAEVRRARALEKITGADVQSGDGGTPAPPAEPAPPAPPDTIAPAAPTDLLGSPAVYQDSTGATFGQITLSWTAPTLNADATPLTDLRHYVVSRRADSDSALWEPVGTSETNSLTASGLAPDTFYRWSVQAVDADGNVSARSAELRQETENDTVPPVEPSAADVTDYLGQLIAAWDGLDKDGAVQAADFHRLEVHASISSLFTPDPTTYRGSIRSAAGGNVLISGYPYGTTVYVRFVAVDRAGNRSDPSAQTSGVPTKVANVDLGDDAVDSAQIKDAAILTAHIDDLAVNNAKIANMAVGKLTTGSLAAGVEIIAGTAGGARTSLTEDGLEQWSGDPEEDTPTIALVNNGSGNYLSMRNNGVTVAGISDTGVVSGTTVSAEEIIYNGRPLSDWLDDRPRGIVAQGYVDTFQLTGITSEVGLYEIAFEAEEDRYYEVTFGPVLVRSTVATDIVSLRVRRTVDGTSPSVSSANILQVNQGIPRANGYESVMVRVSGTFAVGAGGGTVRLLLTAMRNSGTGTCEVLANASTWPLRYEARDLGRDVPDTAVRNTGSGGTTVKKQYVSIWNATWSGSYSGGGSYNSFYGNGVNQGYYSGTNGIQKGMVGFAGNAVSGEVGKSITTAIGSATVSKIEVYLYANHWYYNSGGTAYIGVHGQSSRPASFSYAGSLTSSSWPKPGGRWVTLDSSWYGAFKTGSNKGVTVGGGLASTNHLYYGKFDGVGQTYPPRLRITYTR